MNFRMTFGSVKRSMSRQEAALVKGQNEKAEAKSVCKPIYADKFLS